MTEGQLTSEQELVLTDKSREVASTLQIHSRAGLAQADYLIRSNKLSFFGDLPKVNMIRLYAALAEKAGFMQESGQELSIEGFSPLETERIWAQAVVIRAKEILLGGQVDDRRTNSYYQEIVDKLERRIILKKDIQEPGKAPQTSKAKPNFIFSLAEIVRISLIEDQKVKFN